MNLDPAVLNYLDYVNNAGSNGGGRSAPNAYTSAQPVRSNRFGAMIKPGAGAIKAYTQGAKTQPQTANNDVNSPEQTSGDTETFKDVQDNVPTHDSPDTNPNNNDINQSINDNYGSWTGGDASSAEGAGISNLDSADAVSALALI